MDSSRPLVSVLIPAYNAARTIRTTLSSVLKQTVSDLEVIVVDDGSTDSTPQAVADAGDSRVQVVHQPNAGHASARNTGIAKAQGQYVAFVDADDLWVPDKLARQLEALRDSSHMRAVHSAAVFVDDELRPLFIASCPDGKNSLFDALCFEGLPGVMCTLIAERALLQELHGFDPSLIILQDWELAIRLARRGELHSISDPLALYRVHPASQSKQVELHIEPGERILKEFFADPTIPPEIAARRSYIHARFYAMLCGGAVQVHRTLDAMKWASRAIECDPRIVAYLASFPLRRAKKRRSRDRAVSILREAGYLDVPVGVPDEPVATARAR